MTPTRHEAQRFIEAIAGTEPVTFQTFDDSGSGKKELARVLHGSLDNHYDELACLNKQGAGVFMMINRGDSKGRKAENVVSVRAFFVDLDGTPLERIETAPIAPHMVVETSPDRWHAYWLVRDCPREKFQATQRRLAETFGGDHHVSDLPRVMRLPGFIHRKAFPFKVRIFSEVHSQPIDFATFAIRFHTEESTEDHIRKLKSSFSILPFSSVCSYIPKAVGERNKRLFDYARYCKAAAPEASIQERREMVQTWYADAKAKIRTKDIGICYDEFERAWQQIKTPYGSELSEVMGDLTDPPETVASLGYGEIGYRLMKIMYSLSLHQERRHSGRPIIMGARLAGRILGIDKNDALKILRSFAANGVLSLVSKGAGYTASRWRWVWPEPSADLDGGRQDKTQ